MGMAAKGVPNCEYCASLMNISFLIANLLVSFSCNEHMPKFINYWLERGESNLEIVLQNAFIEVNNAFARYLTYAPQSDEEDLFFSGTTATVCLLKLVKPQILSPKNEY